MWGHEDTKIFSPYYPSGFITTQDVSIVSEGLHLTDGLVNYETYYQKIKTRPDASGPFTLESEGTYRGDSEAGQTLLQLYSADILFYRDDVLSLLS